MPWTKFILNKSFPLRCFYITQQLIRSSANQWYKWSSWWNVATIVFFVCLSTCALSSLYFLLLTCKIVFFSPVINQLIKTRQTNREREREREKERESVCTKTKKINKIQCIFWCIYAETSTHTHISTTEGALRFFSMRD